MNGFNKLEILIYWIWERGCFMSPRWLKHGNLFWILLMGESTIDKKFDMTITKDIQVLI